MLWTIIYVNEHNALVVDKRRFERADEAEKAALETYGDDEWKVIIDPDLDGSEIYDTMNSIY